MSDWLTWQVVDSAFPTGAFAHSWGLESAWQHGEIEGAPALEAFLEASIHQAGHAWSRWTGAVAPLAAMEHAVRATLQHSD